MEELADAHEVVRARFGDRLRSRTTGGRPRGKAERNGGFDQRYMWSGNR
jgi:hypothetical protein